MAAVTAESVTVEIIAKLGKAKADVKDMDATFTSSTSRMQQSARQLEGHLDQLAKSSTSSFSRVGAEAKKAADATDRATGRIANAQRNLGRQVQDVGVGLASGQNPALIFAQQAPQIADALADTGGKAARVASFFAGPFGAAILAAGSILGTVLIPRLFDASDAADTMSKSQADLANFVNTTTGAINRQTTAVQRLAAAQARQGSIEKGTASYAEQRAATITTVAAAGKGTNKTGNGAFGVGTVALFEDDPVKKRLRELAAEAVRTKQPINDFALAVRQAVGDRPEYRGLVKTLTASASKTVELAQGVERLKAEQALLTGTATDNQKALLGIGLATSGLIERQVALATATTNLERARARLSLVQERGREIQAGDGKALTQYRADLVKAQGAVSAAEAAEKAAGAAKRDHAKATREQAKAERERLKDLRDGARAERELLGLRSDVLSSKSDLTSDTRLQDEFARQRIRLDQQGQYSALDERRDRGELTAREYDERKKLIDEIAQNRVDLVNRNESIRAANEELESARAQIGNQRDILQAQEGLARTAKDRAAVQQKLLDLGLEEQRLTAQKVLDLAAQGKASPQEAALAQGTLDALPALRQYGQATIRQSNLSPLAGYLDRIPRSGDEISEAFEGIAVNGIDRVNDGLATAASNFLKLRGVAGTAISGIIADLARLALQRGILSILGRFLPGAVGGGASPFGNDGFSANTPGYGGGFVPDYSGLPRLAGGGTIQAGGVGGVDRNVLSVNGVPRAMIGAHETLSVANPLLGFSPKMAVARATNNVTNVYQTFQLDNRYGVATSELIDHMNQTARSEATRAGGAAFVASQRSAPGTLAQYDKLEG